MTKRIIQTTDGKFIGDIFDEEVHHLKDGSPFIHTHTQDLGSGITRHFNSNYIVTTKEED